MATTKCRHTAETELGIWRLRSAAILLKQIGHMAKLVDALDLGSSGEIHQSSSLCMPTIILSPVAFAAFENCGLFLSLDCL